MAEHDRNRTEHHRTAHDTTDDGSDVIGAAAPMDTLLSEAGSSLGRWLPGRSGLHFAAALARRPAPAARLARDTVAELARVAAGRSQVAPTRKDKRFADPAWNDNAVLRRVVQAYLATATSTMTLVDELDLDWRTDKKIRFLAENVVEALAPSNSPLLNPAVWKAGIDSGGTNLTRGARALVRDLSSRPRVPRMVDPDAFAVGRDLARSPGHVVFRNDLVELIEYTPSTEKVRAKPLLIVPPTINKFYIVDLAPGRSLVEHLVGSGQRVFIISWRNPRDDGADWGTDAYAASILETLDAVEAITGSTQTMLLALCSGGILASMLLAHLAAKGQQKRIAALSLLVTVLDQQHAGTPGALTDHRTTSAATARSKRQGYLDGAALAEVFAWLRPRDLVWNYWVNNYLLGKSPPAFDILSWNADTTRMPARLHRDFIEVAQDNQLTRPGEASLCGTPLDLSTVDVDAYVVAGVADHLCPWQNCYATTQLLGGDTRFVLSTSGHIAAIVNPPGNEKASFHTAAGTAEAGMIADAQEWLDAADKHQGSWWDDYVDWLTAHGGDERDAPTEPGGAGYEALEEAPGSYVLER